ncbi:hypothetical protein BSZ35_08230 [Salinibacter sp. 10B]|uniref:glycosyltransferase family 4 protein n=1 Tax=Salinibacter sp. 10B TaxID=1923971 RepID=UPI000CF368DF|nr:glycosyltransferase family 4 protein [Salinibacter sp. 10B]PQJ34587.1 hypothetical protein BSZ35_08230 [Salinibacter sp. 10B]
MPASLRAASPSLPKSASDALRIDLVFPVLPPVLDGIGDHTAHLAASLTANGHRVRIRTAQSTWTPLDSVQVECAFSLDSLTGVHQLREAVASSPPDLLFVQFNQFSYGKYGFNPVLPWTLHMIRRTHPSVRIVLMAHEEFVPVTSLPNAIMTTWQRAQFWALGRTADAVGFSTSAWIDKFRPWFPDTHLHHLPVGSNIPTSPVTNAEARQHLQIDAPFVVGYFGAIDGSRHLAHLSRTAHRLHEVSNGQCLLLYVGRHGAALRSALGPLPFRDAGPLPPDEVATHFAAMDLYLAPFVKGVSTRRGSFMTSLQHAVPTVATSGCQTDPIFHEHDGRALILAPETDVDAFAEAATALFLRSDTERDALGQAGQHLYRHSFDWPVLAQTVEELARPRPVSTYS